LALALIAQQDEVTCRLERSAFGIRTISCVTFFGLKPSASAADLCSVELLPVQNNGHLKFTDGRNPDEWFEIRGKRKRFEHSKTQIITSTVQPAEWYRVAVQALRDLKVY